VRREAAKLRKMSRPALAFLTRTRSYRATHRRWTSHAQWTARATLYLDAMLRSAQIRRCTCSRVTAARRAKSLDLSRLSVRFRHAIQIPVSSPRLKIEYEVSCSNSCPLRVKLHICADMIGPSSSASRASSCLLVESHQAVLSSLTGARIRPLPACPVSARPLPLSSARPVA
jgi:hypothetical protein